MIYLLQQTINALQLGSIYALVALGYTMVYGVLLMINFAHGDLFMLGAFACFLGGARMNLGFVPTLLVAMLAVGLLGALIERLAYRPLRDAPRVSAIITALGVGIFLENSTLAIHPYPLHVPELVPRAVWSAGGLSISSLQILIIALSIALMLVLNLIVRRTILGMAMRAVSWDRAVVPLMGVPVNLVISATFAIGAALGAAAGVMYALAFPVIDPYMGISVGWKAFISAVIGGIGNIYGAVIGGFLLGGIEVLVAAFLPSTYRDLIAFGLLMLLLVFRPYGILGRPREVKV